MAYASLVPVYVCEVCRKTTSRLLGFIAVLKPSEGTEGGQPGWHAAALGTCAAHRDRIPARFAAQAATRGEVISVNLEPIQLRPRQIEGWYIDVQAAVAQTLRNAGLPAFSSQ